jgi:hypothetical protein
LSSHTQKSGSGSPWNAICADVFKAACADAWLSEASPKEQSTIASDCHGLGTPRRDERSIANAIPTARGRCEAMVEVIGRTASSFRPKTLCRPPAMGSDAAATTPSMTSRNPSTPARAARAR